ncbi:phage major capsid protein [Streptomyces sp. DSM 42041]|uniref:Phage major capsid protein n=1 Tax=Streptomyces hazeniae TaxID=3075538 RepID=A0ABU2NY24_9ACTN|nr:phage major capsid protein [Streptomyces sp. DSM 42041]MDT0381427.1 phage major capsid protein [Streptomyces sp. DSM 42041]
MYEQRVKEAFEERQRHAQAAKSIADKVAEEGREFTAEERTTVETALTEAKAADERWRQAKADRDAYSTVAQFASEVGGPGEPAGSAPQHGGGKSAGGSIGERFVRSAEFVDLLGTAAGGRFGEKQRVQSRPATFKSLVRPARGAKALTTGAGDSSGGALVQPDWRGLQDDFSQFFRPLTLRSLVTQGTTTSDTVEYARVASITNNAAPVAEATTEARPTSGGTAGPLVNATGGGYKPQSTFTMQRKTAVVKTIAHWLAMTKRSISDVAQVQTMVDNFLEAGLEEELEDQMMSGDGTGENFEGLDTISGVQAQAYDTDLLTTARKAVTKIRKIGRAAPTGFVINPTDAERFDLLADGQGRFYFGGPSAAGGANPLWGLPVVQSESVAEGVGYLGDWRQAILWDREESSITATDSHEDFFVRNLVAVLGEMRAAFGVLRPAAFARLDLTAA